jgi:predicted transcriptional regulator
MERYAIMGLQDLYGTSAADRRRTVEKTKVWDPKQLSQSAHEAINLRAQGMSCEKIADIVGINKVSVAYMVNSSLGREKIAAMRGEMDLEAAKTLDEIRTRLPRTLEVLDEVFAIGTLKQKMEMTKTLWCDIAGLAVPKKIDARVSHANLTPEIIEEIKRQGRLSAQAANE